MQNIIEKQQTYLIAWPDHIKKLDKIGNEIVI